VFEVVKTVPLKESSALIGELLHGLKNVPAYSIKQSAPQVMMY
jgi:hypothetical protein